MAEGLSRKRRMRGGHRASATRIITQVYETIESTDIVVGEVITKLKQCNVALQEKLEVVRELDSKILDLVEENELEEEIGLADEFTAKIRRAIADSTNAIEAKQPGTASSPHREISSEPVSPSVPIRVSEGTAMSPKVKLPKLVLKRFNGDLTKWSTFWDSFESSVHNHPSLSGVDKFNYLHSLLEGTASEAISGLKLTSANYEEAIAVLKKRFGNKQQIIARHMEMLLNIDAVTSQYNLKGLRHLYDTVESQVRGLKSLGVSAESYGSLLVSVLLNKLPQELRLIVSRQVNEEEWNLDGLLSMVEKEISARERASSSGQTPRKSTRDLPTGITLVSSTSTSPKCSYCRQPHTSNSCRTVVDTAERKQILRRTGRCYICLRKNHTSRECRSTIRCSKCNGRHHVSICGEGQPPSVGINSTPLGNGGNQGQSQSERPVSRPNTNANHPSATSSTVPTSTSMCCVDLRAPVLLQTARTSVYKLDNPTKIKEVRIIFDTGSQRSYITDTVKKYLSLVPVRTETMVIKTFGIESQNQQVCEVVKAGVNLRDGKSLEMSFLSVPLICEPIANQPIALAIENCNEFASLELADSSLGDDNLEVDILIGSDQYYKLVTGEVIQQCNGLTAIHTRLCWVLSGPVHGLSQEISSVNLVSTHALKVDGYQLQESLDSQLKGFWDLESMGIQSEEHSVYDEFKKCITYNGERYEVKLPWKEFYPVLPDNYDLALKRLNGLLKRLKQDPQTLHMYDSVIRDQVDRGIVEVVKEPTEKRAKQVHYLPHHAVHREDKKTTKLRVVFDASAKTNGPALNDCLYAGPKFGQNIMEIMLRFRVHKVALAADIEKAFLMIAMAPEDRNVLRFLWVDDISKQVPEVVVLRFTRVVFGVSSSPFLLNATIRHHMENYSTAFPEFVKMFLRSIYVDDVSYGADDVDSAYELYLKSKTTLAEGGFNLRKFVTNSVTLNNMIGSNECNVAPSNVGMADGIPEDRTYIKDLLGTRQAHPDCEQRVLGVRWNFVQDELIFDLNELAILVKRTLPTKRQIVAITTKFYDPLGFISPVVIRFKILFQAMCISKIGWDEPLTGELLSQWKSLVSTFQGVSTAIPRCYFTLSQRLLSQCSLQGFCDASSAAYAAVVYLKIEVESGSAISFVAAKTRVAPTTKQTIPRLELLSALLLSNLIDNVATALKPELDLSEHCCYTDSKVALYWIKGIDKEWKPFITNRVNEIRRRVPPVCWRHCPGRENPADLPSRGMSPNELAGSRLWRYGPDWLIHPRTSRDEELEMPEDCLKEIKTTHCPTHSLLTAEGSNSLSNIIHCENYSNLLRLLRVTAYVCRFVEKVRAKIRGVNAKELNSELTAAELNKAERLWVIESQKSFKEEPAFEVWKRQLELFTQDGIWRCKGRLSKADLPYTTKHPALLPKDHHLTLLIIWKCHERVMHNGVKDTLNELRAKFWINRGRQLVRKVLYKCTICHRFEGQPYNLPPPPPLPNFRVAEEPAFTYTGVDFAGPLYVKTAGPSTETKTWICLYTCCVVRAIHLDLVPDMTAESFIRSFKRFTARRGFPHKIISDNGKTFKAAAKTIASVLNHPEVLHYFAGVGMQWSFNLEKAPWWGGVFERMIKSVKRCLRKTIGRAKLTHDELLTALTEVEVIVNSRPLSYLSTEDIEEPLTPSHLLIGRRVFNLPDGNLHCGLIEGNDMEFTHESLNRRMDHLNKTLNHFWKRWKNEYLLQLRECHRYGPKTDVKGNTLSEGEVVLIHSDSKLRGFWKLGRVQRLVKGDDGHVRGAILKVPSRTGQTTILRRPLRCLYPLEVNSHLSKNVVEADTGDNLSNSKSGHPRREVLSSSSPDSLDRDQGTDTNTARPPRQAAKRAREFIDTVMADQSSDSEQ